MLDKEHHQANTGKLDVYQVANESYEQLAEHAIKVGRIACVPQESIDKTFRLLGKLREHDAKTAKESLQALPLAQQIGSLIGEFYDTEVDQPSLWSAALLHDVGKIAVPKQLIDKSNEGRSWTDEDRKLMSIHAVAGAYMAKLQGFPRLVTRPIEEHHHKQIGNYNYGHIAELSQPELHIRDSIASADFADAMLNRTNTRNAHLTQNQRQHEVVEDLQFLFNEYPDSSQLISVITDSLFDSASRNKLPEAA